MLRIESGCRIMGDVKPVDGDSVRFVTEDGRTMFEVGINKDGRSIEVRGVEVTKHEGELYDCWLSVSPRTANTVIIRTEKYDGK